MFIFRSTQRQLLKVVLATLMAGWVGGFLVSPSSAQCVPDWLPGDGVAGVNGRVYATTTWDPDGPGPQPEVVVVGGIFNAAGDVLANNIACWDPATQQWSALGTGTSSDMVPGSGAVRALAVLDGKLYAGGDFAIAGGTSAKFIACWDPSTQTWLPLGTGMNDYVYALAALDGKLYVGGGFTLAGGMSAKRVACWDPVSHIWSALGSGTNSLVSALTVLNGKLYVGGSFYDAGGVSAHNIACWDPATTAWSALGSGTTGSVKALTALNGQLYAGGEFTFAAEVVVSNVARWDPSTSTWSALGAGVDRAVSAMTVLDGKLYVGGKFDTAGGVASPNVACWAPASSTWSALGAGVGGGWDIYENSVLALTALNGRLYAGGYFTLAGGGGAANIAYWSLAESTWSPLSPGISGTVDCMISFGHKLYAGGTFSHIDGVSANRVACWDPATSTWSALGAGLTGGFSRNVRALAVFDSKLYVGGNFHKAGEVNADGIACWNPATSTWTSLGQDLFGEVYALAVLNGKVYVGGSFYVDLPIGGAENIACWDPATSTWSGLGLGTDGDVYSLAVLNGKLYAGGKFQMAGDICPNNIACWDPVSAKWSPLGNGVNSSVYALTALDGKLYAGGSFIDADGAIANGIACWNPATLTWSALGSGMAYSSFWADIRVFALTTMNGKLYAGGIFETSGDVMTNGIACWDPITSIWSGLGEGMADSYVAHVNALAELDGTLYAGGGFVTTGEQLSVNWARWKGCPQPSIAAAFSRKMHGTAGTFDVVVTSPSAIESRKGGAANVVVVFDKEIVAVSGMLSDVTTSQGTIASLAIDGQTLDIGLADAVGPQAVTLAFPGIASFDTGYIVTQTLCFRVLAGDASGDGVVNTSDYVAVRGRIGQAIGAANCRYDVNVDGTINTSDYIYIRGRLGTAAGSCP